MIDSKNADEQQSPKRSCPNCEAALTRPTSRFCGACGQETDVKPPTLMEFAQQFGGSYISMEGALWRTLWCLLQPGQLTLEYFAGRRRRYVLPLRLYLTISVLVIVLLKLSGGGIHINLNSLSSEKLTKLPAQSGVMIDAGNVQVGMRDGQAYCSGLPDNVCERFRHRLNLDPVSLSNELREAKARFFGHLGAAMFLLLPAFAIWMKLVFIDKRRRYTEHLVFALHLHAFWFVTLPFLLLELSALNAMVLLACMVYPVVAMKRVYSTRWSSTAIRAAIVALFNLTTLSVILAGVMVFTLLF